MATLSDVMAEAIRARLPVLIFNPSAEVVDLELSLKEYSGDRRVVTHDWSKGAPERAIIGEVVQQELREETLLHLAVAADIEPHLERALLEVVVSGRYPGQLKNIAPTSALLVVSTRARYLTEVSLPIAEHFPLKVGAAEWL